MCQHLPPTPSTDGPTIWAAQHCRRETPSVGSAWAALLLIGLATLIVIGGLFAWALQ